MRLEEGLDFKFFVLPGSRSATVAGLVLNVLTGHASSPVSKTLSAPLAVELLGVCRRFDPQTIAVDQLNLSIPAGQFVSLVGPSGCGKSTLLRLIAGLDTPTAGSIRLAGNGRVGYVFQDPHLLPWRTVAGNVELPLELTGVAGAQRRDRARDALRAVGLGEFSDRYPAQLSGGMRMRASLARAIVGDPDLLLLDEPFAAIDEINRQLLDEQLRTLWHQRNMTVIFVTHSIGEATYLSERVVVLSARPARIVMDRLVDLPTDRPAAVRTEPTFARQARDLLEGLMRGQLDSFVQEPS